MPPVPCIILLQEELNSVRFFMMILTGIIFTDAEAVDVKFPDMPGVLRKLFTKSKDKAKKKRRKLLFYEQLTPLSRE